MALDLPDPGEQPWGTKLNSAITAVDNDLQSTKTSLDARLDSLEAAPPGGGVTDHGLLNGLGDNDHPQYQLTAAKGQPGGYASLSGTGKVPSGQLPPSSGGSLPDDVSGAWYSGRLWYALGTSLTIDGSYTNRLRDLSGMVLINRGVGGATLSTASNGNIWTQMTTAVGNDAEVITIETINDSRLNVPLGTVADGEDQALSYYGAMKAACAWLLTNRPAARVFFITAYSDAFAGGYPNFTTPNSLGKFQWQYNNAMKEVASIYGVPILDVGGESGINAYTGQYFTIDGIHLSANGGTRHSEYCWAKMKSLGWETSRPTAPGAAAPVSVTGVAIDVGSAVALAPTDKQQMFPVISPSNASNKGVVWSTNNAAVATVSSDGMVTAVANGSANIKVTTSDGGFIAICAVTVSVAAATGVTVSPTAWTGLPTQTQQLTATVSPSNAGNKNVTWASNTPSKATVNSFGLVTAVANGIATITATTADGGFTSTCTVTVSNTVPVTSVSLDPDAVTVNVGGTAQLTATVLPGNASNKVVSYSSNAPAIATVNSSGLVTAVAPGSAVITVTTTDGAKTDTSAITVPVSAWNLHKATNYTGLGVTGLGVNGNNDPTWATQPWPYSVIFFNDYLAGDNACEFTCTGAPGTAGWGVMGTDGTTKFAAVGDLSAVSINYEAIITSAGAGAFGTPAGYDINNGLGTLTDGVKIRMAREGDIFHLWKWNGTGWTESIRVNMGTQSAKFAADSASWSYKGLGLMIGGAYSVAKDVMTGTYLGGSNVAVTGISITPPTATLTAGGSSQTLSVAFTPSNASNKVMSWSSDTPGVATVNAAGVVTGVAVGTATITGASQDGNYTDTCVVTVNAAATEWTMSPQTTFRSHNLTGLTSTGSNPSFSTVAAGTYGALILNTPGDNAVEFAVVDGSVGLWIIDGAHANNVDFTGLGDLHGGPIANIAKLTSGVVAIGGIIPSTSVPPAYATDAIYRIGRIGTRVRVVRVDPGPTTVILWEGDLAVNHPVDSAFYSVLDLGVLASGGSYTLPKNCKTGTWTPPS